MDGCSHCCRISGPASVEEGARTLLHFFAELGVFGLGAFLEMVGILEGLVPLPGRLGVSEASEQTERASCSSDASEASLPRRLLALLPARLPARLVGPLAVDAPLFGSEWKQGGGIFTFRWFWDNESAM